MEYQNEIYENTKYFICFKIDLKSEETGHKNVQQIIVIGK